MHLIFTCIFGYYLIRLATTCISCCCMLVVKIKCSNSERHREEHFHRFPPHRRAVTREGKAEQSRGPSDGPPVPISVPFIKSGSFRRGGSWAQAEWLNPVATTREKRPWTWLGHDRHHQMQRVPHAQEGALRANTRKNKDLMPILGFKTEDLSTG